MVGTELKISPAISLDIQGYHKRFFDQARATIAPPAGSTDVDVTDLKYTSIGFGRSYGLEVLLRHALTDRFFGWIAYSLSRTERDYLGGTEFSLGPFDQPHNLIVVASYKLPYDFIVGARMRFASGPLDTPIVGAVYDANANYYFPLQGKPNSRRLPAFFQLDARVDKRFVFQSWMLSLYLDVQNMTNQQNVEGVANNFDYTKEQYIYGLPVIPSIGIRGEW